MAGGAAGSSTNQQLGMGNPYAAQNTPAAQGYGSPFGGGMMGGGYGMNQGMNPYAPQPQGDMRQAGPQSMNQGYGSPFGGGFGQQMGGFNPYAQQGGMGGYGSPFGGGYGSPFGGGMRGGMGRMGGMFGGMGGMPGNSGFPDPMSRGGMRDMGRMGGMGGGKPAPGTLGSAFNADLTRKPATPQQGPTPQGGFDSFGDIKMTDAIHSNEPPQMISNAQYIPPGSVNNYNDPGLGSFGGLGGLAQLLRGVGPSQGGFFKKGGKVRK